jgi:hypothetical protein
MIPGSAPQVVELSAGQVEIPRAAVIRYLGMGRAAPPPQVEDLLEQALSDFNQVVRYRASCLTAPVTPREGGTDLSVLFAPGKALAKNLAGCDRAILFAATVGTPAELQRKRAQLISPARALVLDAVGTAAIEAFCDRLCEGWEGDFAPGKLRPRFSPGYADLPLSLQKPFLEVLDAGRRLGITLTEALLMIPQKSVTAIVGLGREGCERPRGDCFACEKKDCEFRL